MKRQYNFKILPAAVLAVAAATLSIGGLASLAGKETFVDFANPHDGRAYDLLRQSSSKNSALEAKIEAQKAISLSPYNNSARLRLSYIDAMDGKPLGKEGLEQLARSYYLIPLDHTVAAWRVQFALEHWSELTPEIRRAVEAEAMAFGQVGSQDANVLSALHSIRDPEGRLAAALWLHALANDVTAVTAPR